MREIQVYAAELLESDGARARFRIECSSGTYIRTLIEELGDAFCEELRRTAVGHLRIEDADETLPRPAVGLVSHLPARELSRPEAIAVVQGRRLEAGDGEPAVPVRLMLGQRLLAIARPHDGSLVTEVVLA